MVRRYEAILLGFRPFESYWCLGDECYRKECFATRKHVSKYCTGYCGSLLSSGRSCSEPGYLRMSQGFETSTICLYEKVLEYLVRVTLQSSQSWPPDVGGTS